MAYRKVEGKYSLVQLSVPKAIARTVYKSCVPKWLRGQVEEFRYRRYKRWHEDPEYSLREYVERKCVFVHIPKTGGVSVSHALFGGRSGGHMTYRDYQRVLGKRQVRRSFSFAFVRNPWDRLVSAYEFLKKGGMNDDDKLWADRQLAGFSTFEQFVEEWVNEENVRKGVHFKPQADFVWDDSRDVAVDFVGKFERFEEDFNEVLAALGVASSLPHLNKSHRRSYIDCYSSRTEQIVARVYRSDIELFGYSFR